MAEFDDPTALVAAAHRARHAGLPAHGRLLAVPDRGAARGARHRTHTRLPLIVLIGGLVGCVGGYALQYWASVIAYPLNVGGQPLHSWPAFIPVTFECTILVRRAVGACSACWR